MSTGPSGPIPITPGQLLLLDPTAYVNLLLMFPWPEGVKSIDDLPAFELDGRKHQLLLIGPREVVLLSKSPPGILHFDKKKCEWIPLQA